MASAFHRDVSASLDRLAGVLPPGERDARRLARSLARAQHGFKRGQHGVDVG